MIVVSLRGVKFLILVSLTVFWAKRHEIWPSRSRLGMHAKKYRKIYMLFAGWEVRIVKNCDLGLENAARGREENLAHANNQSECRIRYRAL